LLGTAPKSAADAVERQRPLEPGQSTAKTYGLAVKAMWEAVRDAVTIPLFPLILVGLAVSLPPGPRARAWLFLTIIAVATMLALVRLHATGGYCSPRHAMVLALLLFPAAAAGLAFLLRSVAIPARWLGMGEGRFTLGPAVWVLVLAGLIAWQAKAALAPLNADLAGYREAGAHLAKQATP